MVLARALREELSAFVAAMQLGDEVTKIDWEEAKTNLLEWKKEEIDIAFCVTPTILMDEWNKQVRERKEGGIWREGICSGMACGRNAE